MKKFSKRAVAIILAVIMTFSCMVGFAASDQEEIPYAEVVKNIARNLQALARYENVTEASVYFAALEMLLNENPELYEPILRAMIGSVDENSNYFNAEEAKAFITNLDDKVVGIGVSVLAADGKIIVSKPVPGSPAEKAGIKAGDIILSANGVSLEGMDLDVATDHIRGEEGTTVDITVQRAGLDAPITFTIVREVVDTKPVDMEIIEKDGKKIGRVIIHSFTQNVAEHFKKALDQMDANKVKDIIIDLRDNGGGYLDQAILIADMFLPKGVVIATEDYKIDILDRTYKASGNGKKYNTVVLINERTASASEILTAALSENNAAKVVGTKSYGKGTVQSMFDLPLDAVMKVTIAYYLTPKGNNVHTVGVTPDEVVENTTVPVDMTRYNVFAQDRVYKVGDSGAAVKNAKIMLEDFGLFIGEINENYDENLKIAVKLYQQATSLYPYGVLDITTQMSLYETMRGMNVEVDNQLDAAIDILR